MLLNNSVETLALNEPKQNIKTMHLDQSAGLKMLDLVLYYSLIGLEPVHWFGCSYICDTDTVKKISGLNHFFLEGGGVMKRKFFDRDI